MRVVFERDEDVVDSDLLLAAIFPELWSRGLTDYLDAVGSGRYGAQPLPTASSGALKAAVGVRATGRANSVSAWSEVQRVPQQSGGSEVSQPAGACSSGTACRAETPRPRLSSAPYLPASGRGQGRYVIVAHGYARRHRGRHPRSRDRPTW